MTGGRPAAPSNETPRHRTDLDPSHLRRLRRGALRGVLGPHLHRCRLGDGPLVLPLPAMRRAQRPQPARPGRGPTPSGVCRRAPPHTARRGRRGPRRPAPHRPRRSRLRSPLGAAGMGSPPPWWTTADRVASAHDGNQNDAVTLTDLLPAISEPDSLFDAFSAWVEGRGLAMYPAQEDALIEVVSGSNVIVSTPTGSGKSLIAAGAHFTALSARRAPTAADGRPTRSFYTAPVKALVSEKFFDLCATFGTANVGMMTGDASVNGGAPIICCTAEVLANIALRYGPAADVGQVVMDEFHFYSDPDRGWAWQVPILELPRAQFVLMSATLGDVTRLEVDLTRRTGRPTAVVSSGTRRVPPSYSYRMTPLPDTIEDLA